MFIRIASSVFLEISFSVHVRMSKRLPCRTPFGVSCKASPEVFRTFLPDYLPGSRKQFFLGLLPKFPQDFSTKGFLWMFYRILLGISLGAFFGIFA